MINQVPFSKIHIRIISYLLVLIPIFLITGPFLSDLCATIISLITIFHIIKNKDYIIFNNIFVKLFFLFWLNSSVITLYHYYASNYSLETNSLSSSLTYIRFIFFAIGISKILNDNKKIFKLLFYSISVCFLFLIVDSYFQLIFDNNLLNFPRDESGRISSFFGDELVMGGYVVRLLFILIGLYFYLNFKENYKKLLFATIVVLSISIIFLSGERSAILLLTLGAIILLFLIKFDIKNIILGVGSIIIIITMLINFDSGFKKRIIDRTLLEGGISSNQVSYLNGSKYSHFTQQINFYLTSYNIFKANYLGSGNRSFGKLCKKYRADKESVKAEFTQSCSSHSHNTYMQLLSENGIQGFLILVVIFFILFFVLIKQFYLRIKSKAQYSKFETLILISIFLNFFPFIQNGNFFNNWLSITYYMPIGLFLHYLSNKKTIKIQ